MPSIMMYIWSEKEILEGTYFILLLCLDKFLWCSDLNGDLEMLLLPECLVHSIIVLIFISSWAFATWHLGLPATAQFQLGNPKLQCWELFLTSVFVTS